MKHLRRFAAAALAAGSLFGSPVDAEETSTSPADGILTPVEHRRTPDQTFLTFPEWFLVHSPAEYAQFLAVSERPSQFPLFSHIGQFWSSYAAVTGETEKFPFNGGYHLMVMVIGTSTTVEYTLKGTYEHTIGRLAEATKSTALVPEEQFAARYAQAYVDFIRVDPWYKFSFWNQFKLLWAGELPVRGPDLIRRWERRFVLSAELLVKEGYAHVIKLGSDTVYDAPKPTTAVVLTQAPGADADHPDFTILDGSRADGKVIATIPRYEGFTTYGRWLASRGADFVEVAGNRGDILVSEIVPSSWEPARGRILFEQPILTHPGHKRVAFALPVAGLGAELRDAAAHPGEVVVEHIYDF
jgi:hypothetical protein